ncbi:MAG TPA: 5-oxoprolinase [bacterium]|nr:5-oxoprolinase [bacterium]
MIPHSKKAWHIWIDTGGTFTDCIAVDPRGQWHRAKVLSSSALRGRFIQQIDEYSLVMDTPWHWPSVFLHGYSIHIFQTSVYDHSIESYDASSGTLRVQRRLPADLTFPLLFEIRSSEEAPVLACRIVTQTPPGRDLPPVNLRLATTRGTNALLEGKGGKTVLFITRGFEDLLSIGNQQRPDLFALHIKKSVPLTSRVIGVKERVDARGRVIEPLHADILKTRAIELLKEGVETAVVSFLNSYLFPEHERELSARLRDWGFHHVVCSSENPFIKFLPRTETAVVNGALMPILADYLDCVSAPLKNGKLFVMTSAGGLVRDSAFYPKDSLLSGPAGGVVGAVHAGLLEDRKRIIAFDMGGTSTDVSRYDGDYDYVFEHQVGGAHLVAPALAIESVAAGGGSICTFESSELKVGPESSGADPGPACYGAGGPLTLTDVNLLLGRLSPDRFEIPIVEKDAWQALDRIRDKIRKNHQTVPDEIELLQGFLDIAAERMADAIRKISVRKGYNPADYTLVAFGGAGGQQACGVAERLNMCRIIIPADSSLLSALGLGHAAVERFVQKQILKPLGYCLKNLSSWIDELEAEALKEMAEEGFRSDCIEIRRRILRLRLEGQDSTLQVEYHKTDDPAGRFIGKYESVFGYRPDGRDIELESIRVAASTRRNVPMAPKNKSGFSSPAHKGEQIACFQGKKQSVPLYDRASLHSGQKISGPALIAERHSMTVVEPGWEVTVSDHSALCMEKKLHTDIDPHARAEIVQLELFVNRFQAIAGEMGEMLRRMSLSTNVKERLDFSCALLDPKGELVVNAPHIPVHLGSLGLCVRSVMKKLSMEPGDVWITNHPRYGGSHLPDISVITPVFLKDGRLLAFTANRAHHAEIGGLRPGSMPSEARSLIEEGVLIEPMHLYHRGKDQWNRLQRILTEAPFPSRRVDENLADVRAAVAANINGSRALLDLAEKHGADSIWEAMEKFKERAESRIRHILKSIPDGKREAQESLDDGTQLKVALSIQDDTLKVDFRETAGLHPFNLNATPAIINSVVIYVLRLLVDEPMPLNEGFMRPVQINLPTGLLNPHFPDDPSKAPAVAGGNVETSQRLVDTLMKALQMSACSQGTMNNVIFGNERFSYYETVGGGSGAGPDFSGADGVHTHMTNTRITDPEIIEHRFPVRIIRFAIRKGSGGKGRFNGGDGLIREYLFLEPVSLSLLGEHRIERPYGLEGGRSGQRARQIMITPEGRSIELQSRESRDIESGSRFILETPGGGGYGTPQQGDKA